MASYRPGNFEWTPDARETLVKLRADGLSASKIAGMMGATKGSIIGAMQRFGLSKPGGTPIIRDGRPRRASEIAQGKRRAALPGIGMLMARRGIPTKGYRTIPYDHHAIDHGRGGKIMDQQSRQEATWSNVNSTIGMVASADQRAIDSVTLSRMVAFIPTLPRSACCWPMWGTERPSHLYCGDPSLPGRSYCADHHVVAYQPRAAKSPLPFNIGW